MQVEIIRQTQWKSHLYMPGRNKPEFPDEVAQAMIDRGDARPWPPVEVQPAAVEQDSEPEHRKQRGARNRMQRGGHDRLLSSEALEDSHTPLSAVGASSGTRRG